jgi:hypothetical protein
MVAALTAARGLGCLGACGVAAIGVLGLINGDDSSQTVIQATVRNIYRILFALLIILAEARLYKVLVLFTFLRTWIGRGVFYIFVGTLSIGDKWWEKYAFGPLMAAVGLFFIFVPCCIDVPKEIDADSKV